MCAHESENQVSSITAICYSDFNLRLYVLQPQRFKGWFFPRHQVKPTLLGPVDRTILCRFPVCLDSIFRYPAPRRFLIEVAKMRRLASPCLSVRL
jgi:hypothetical protein